MIKVDVLIVYEHVSRELESALLLKKELAKFDISAVVVQYGWTEPAARFLYNPKIIVAPWCYDDKDYEFFRGFVGGYEGGKFKIVNLHSEQIGSSENSDYMLPSGKAKDVFHFVWGDYFKDKLLECETKSEKILITGNIRLDFFREDYRKICMDRTIMAEQYGLDINKKWLLFIGSFNGEFIQGKDLTHLVERGYKNIETLRKVTIDSYNEILNWLEFICENEDVKNNYEIIYRPHPSEYVTDKLKNLMERYNNFIINNDYAIRDWIVNSDLIYAWNSTSAVEVLYANKPLHFLRPVEIPEKLTSPMIESVEKITKRIDFLNSLIQANETKGDLNKKVKEIMNYYYQKDKCSAVSKMVDFIRNYIGTDEDLLTSNISLHTRLALFVKYILKVILKYTGLIRFSPKLSTIAGDAITPKKMKEYVKRIDILGEINAD